MVGFGLRIHLSHERSGCTYYVRAPPLGTGVQVCSYYHVLSTYYVEIPSHFILSTLGGGYFINLSSQMRRLRLLGVGAGGTLWGVSSAHHTTLFSQTSPSIYRGADLAVVSALCDPPAQADWTGPGQSLGSCRVSHPLPCEEPAFKHSLWMEEECGQRREKQLRDKVGPGCGGHCLVSP